jgi:hypothetical protein
MRLPLSCASSVFSRAEGFDPWGTVLVDPHYSYLLIVRRHCEEKFAFLEAAFAQRAGVRVIEDRRVADRRRRQDQVPADRRRSERRLPLPPSWDVADYVLVPEREP